MGSVPSFPFPERAVRALARSASYAEWRRRPAGTTRQFEDIDVASAREIVDRGLAGDGGWLDAAAVDALLRAVGIATPAMEIVRSADDAFEAATRIGAAVALKAQGPELLHKTESNALRLGLASECEARDAYIDLQRQTRRRHDSRHRPGDGERWNRSHDRRHRANDFRARARLWRGRHAGGASCPTSPFESTPSPISTRTTCLRKCGATKLLRGFRGAAPADIEAVKETLARVSALISICPEIQELDLNPLKVLEHGAVVVDARIRVERRVQAEPSRRIAY